MKDLFELVAKKIKKNNKISLKEDSLSEKEMIAMQALTLKYRNVSIKLVKDIIERKSNSFSEIGFVFAYIKANAAHLHYKNIHVECFSRTDYLERPKLSIFLFNTPYEGGVNYNKNFFLAKRCSNNLELTNEFYKELVKTMKEDVEFMYLYPNPLDI